MHDAEYVAQVNELRGRKDVAFRNESWSPIPVDARREFHGLAYYPPDPRYRFVADLEPDDEEVELDVPVSTGGTRRHVRKGWFRLKLPDGEARLAAYDTEGHHQGELFVPFRDATSSKETYGAGRYLEAYPLDDGRWLVDLNAAYNPYCAYSEDYACPLPPPENWLKVAVRAGERYAEGDAVDAGGRGAAGFHDERHDHAHHR